jgi:2'-5' RNA ligase
MYRLFVAIDLPDELRVAASDLCSTLGDARRVPAEQLHLTLRFIGDVDAETCSAIKKSLAGISVPSFVLTVRGIGHFPPGHHPRVLWVGLGKSEPLLTLQREVELALVGAGIAPEERRFSPHITIARLRDTPPAQVLSLEERHRDFGGGSFTVTAFHLYSSILTRSGAIHTREATYPLSPAMTPDISPTD